MERRTRAAFALLVIAQAAHSVEEYVARLFDVFPPARFVSRLFSGDPSTGFIIANALLIAAALWCLACRSIVHGRHRSDWVGSGPASKSSTEPCIRCSRSSGMATFLAC